MEEMLDNVLIKYANLSTSMRFFRDMPVDRIWFEMGEKLLEMYVEIGHVFGDRGRERFLAFVRKELTTVCFSF